jgi:excisionase family DNA binding protein
MVEHKENDTMLTVSDVASLLNVHINTIRRWSNQGILKAYRIGSRGDRRFHQEDVTSFLSQEAETVKVKKRKIPSNRINAR